MIKKLFIKKINSGMALVEIIIGSAIISVGILSLISAYNIYVEYAFANQKNVQASYLMEEGLEAVYFLRDKGWNSNITTLTDGTKYYLVFNGSYWATSTIPNYIDGEFVRTVSVEKVYRDSSDRISETGIEDVGTKKVTAEVSYLQKGATTTKSISTYVSNIYDN